jgi:release factor glutamine methyltransferase
VVTWRQLYVEAVDRLRSNTEARWLVEEAAGDPWPAALDRPVTARAGAWFDQLLARRESGEPFQYVVGHWPFRTLDLMVDRRVLIPRPETEVVVEVALAEMERLTATGGLPDTGPPLAVDLGTGSGAIALSLAAEHRGLQVWATDASEDALAVARANLAGLGGFVAPRVRMARGSWWNALPPDLAGRVSLVVSNPPYVTRAELSGLDPSVADWEPHQALAAGPEGTEDIQAILDGAAPWLAPRAAVVVEIAPHQAERVTALAGAAGFVDISVRRDLAGRKRVLVARRSEGITGLPGSGGAVAGGGAEGEAEGRAGVVAEGRAGAGGSG